ncbi:PREDICTED: protein BOLA2-like [Camelina sativa]|uniref:Protein BOLA2-like n=1 Tax=Camelina sativa TaxID=90675 RepID=A0ABM0UQ50_CAMSA|nr:PREDICTED: protein BOLA2-like [Camelina sativa]
MNRVRREYIRIGSRIHSVHPFRVIRGHTKFLQIIAAQTFKQKEREMGVSKEQVEASLTSKLNPVHLEVIDTSGGCGASFVVEIVSEQFEEKRLLERHRIINAALEEEMKEIHALSIKKAQTPQQWKPISQLSETIPTTEA